MKKVLIFAALFVSAFAFISCVRTYEDDIRERMAKAENKDGLITINYDEKRDEILSEAALKYYGEGFDYPISSYSVYCRSCYEYVDTVYVRLFDNKYDTIEKRMFELLNMYRPPAIAINKLERTRKVYVDTTDIVAYVTCEWRVFKSVQPSVYQFNFFARVRDNDVSVFDYKDDKISKNAFAKDLDSSYRTEYEYREIR